MWRGWVLLCCLISALVRAEPLPVVASFSILADFTARVGGDRVRVHTLVGPDSDAHVYQPTPADARALSQAKLVVVNGLGFEGWIPRLVRSSGFSGRLVEASRGVAILKRQPAPHTHAHDTDVDPHAWLDPANARVYVTNIADALAALDPAGSALYRANAQRFIDDIAALDRDIAAQLDPLPPARRVVVSSHGSFAYFGRAYRIEFRAPVGLTTEASPSAAEVGRLIRHIRADKIPAVFLENITDARLLERIRAETGARIGGVLYSDALSARGGPAGTYLQLMRHNATVLAAALKGA